MKYFIICFVFFSILGSVIAFLRYLLFLKRKFLKKRIAAMLMNEKIFFDAVVKEVVDYVVKAPKKTKEILLEAVWHKNINLFTKNINNQSVKAKLLLITRGIGVSNWAKNDDLFKLLCVEKYILQKNFEKAYQLLRKVNENVKNPDLAVIKLFLDAQLAFFEGDLLNASVWTRQVAKISKKKKMVYEEAQSWFLMGEICSRAKMFDCAYFLLRKAAALFDEIESYNKKSEVLTALGLVCLAQNRCNEAEDFWKDALQLANKVGNANVKKIILNKRKEL